jgi:hypothetical protein
VVYCLRLHSDSGRPTTIFYTTFNYPTTVINSRHTERERVDDLTPRSRKRPACGNEATGSK